MSGYEIEEVFDKEIKTEEVNESIVEVTSFEKKDTKESRKLIFIIALLIILIISGLCWLFWVNRPNNIVQTETVTEIIPISENNSIKVVDGEKTAIEKTVVQKDTAIIPVMKEERVASLADTIEYCIVGTKATHVLQKGETIIRVSLKYFGSKNYWPYIAKHNEKVIKDANNVPIGTKLLIPELSQKQ